MKGFAELRKKIIEAGKSSNHNDERWLLSLARDPKQHPAIRRSAMVALRRLRSPSARTLFIQLLMTEHANENLRETAIKSLGAIGEASDLDVLAGLAASESIARFGRQAAQNAADVLLKRLHLDTSSFRATTVSSANSMRRDVFLCHASEDKTLVVDPLVAALKASGISYWYDRAEITWGDSLTGKVNEGLSVSDYVVVVLSAAFLANKWPQFELEAALNIEASSGRVVVLPLLVGSANARAQILSKLPILNHKLYVQWDGRPDAIVAALTARLRLRTGAHTPPPHLASARKPKLPITPSAKTKARWKHSLSQTALRMNKVLFIVRALRSGSGREPVVLVTRSNPQWKVKVNRDSHLAFLFPSISDDALSPQDIAAECARYFDVDASSVKLEIDPIEFNSLKYNPTIGDDTDYHFRFVFVRFSKVPRKLRQSTLIAGGRRLEWRSLLQLRRHRATMKLNQDVVIEVRRRYGDVAAKWLSFQSTLQ